jgi:hypothetical protein
LVPKPKNVPEMGKGDAEREIIIKLWIVSTVAVHIHELMLRFKSGLP